MKKNNILFLATLLLFSTTAHSVTFVADDRQRFLYEDDQIYMLFFMRSPDQMAAFYEGREFSKAAVKRIINACNVTVIIKNKTRDFMWLELDKWEFSRNNKIIQRYDRKYWAAQWNEIKLKKAHQSTYGWTLLPETRDLHPEEGVGGSVPIPAQSKPFTLKAHFTLGAHDSVKIKTVVVEKIQCQK